MRDKTRSEKQINALIDLARDSSTTLEKAAQKFKITIEKFKAVATL